MFSVYRKAVVAVVGAVLSVLGFHGVAVPEFLTPDAVGAFFSALTPVLVWLVPNAEKPEA